jgi:peptidoglycan/xylan/chitin deacetylase (PgdA/CDA1 family)
LRNTMARALQVGSRFGVTAAKMEGRLTAYAGLVEEYGAHPSLPITASVLDRNPQVAHRLVGRGVELCIHGLVHTDLSRLSAETQQNHIDAAVAVFRRHGLGFKGFRSPYLKYDNATLRIVEGAGFEYDSNLPFYWDPPGSVKDLSTYAEDGLKRGLEFYRPVRYPAERSVPRYTGKIVEIPVSLPDDEILLDRMGLAPARIGDTWLEMAKMALERGELLTLQLHPERLILLQSALRSVLDFAKSTGDFWIATMGEIASWWRSRTGVEVKVTRAGEGLYQVGLAPSTERQPKIIVWEHGRHSDIEAGQRIACRTRPLVGLHPNTSSDFRRHISETGYLFELSEDSSVYPVYIGEDIAEADLIRRTRDVMHPLLAVSRWPRPYRSALAVTGDIDCLTLGDFLRRFRED